MKLRHVGPAAACAAIVIGMVILGRGSLGREESTASPRPVPSMRAQADPVHQDRRRAGTENLEMPDGFKLGSEGPMAPPPVPPGFEKTWGVLPPPPGQRYGVADVPDHH